MTPKSTAATDAALRLWARAAGDAKAPEEVAEATERVCTQLRADLGRWIGDEGYCALLNRALGLVRVEHHALGGLACLGGDEPATAAAVQANSAGEVAAGLVALMAVLIDLLGRIIGEQMAVRLVDQVGMPNPREAVNTATEGGLDD
jgi:hypothetical protein